MKWIRRVLLVALLGVPSIVVAQDVTGHLEGVVVDEQGDPLPGANVVVTGESVMGLSGVVTRADGHFRVLALPVGDVTVRISFVGFETLQVSGIRISLGETRSLGRIEMRPEAVSMDGVTITGRRPAIDVATTTIGSSMAADRFAQLPIDRGISSVAALLPQANESYLGDQLNVGGATGSENAWYFDGVNTTSGFDGTAMAELPYNFVREIQIKSGGYEAEYGRASGGIITVLTESGSNTVKASAFGFLTNNALSAEARKSFSDQISTDDFLRYDAGFGIGGPIIKDRLWYYGAYNRKVESRDVLFDAIGQRAEKSTSNIYAAKLSWKASDNTRLDLSAFGNPSEGDRIGGWMFWSIPTAVENEDPILGKTSQGTHTVALNASHVLSEDVLLEGRASWFELHDNIDPATELGAREPLIDTLGGTWSGGFPGFGRQNARRAAVALAGTWFVGGSSIKAGVEYEENLSEGRRIIRSETGLDVGTVTGGGPDPYGGLQGAGAIAKWGPSFWAVFHQNDGADVYGRNATAYVQTRLRLTPRLAATAGLRWDTQAFRSQDYDYRFTLPWQWQPRIGMVYEPGDRGTQKVFAHVGRFYEQVPLASSLTYMIPPLCWMTFFDHDPTVDPTGGNSGCITQSPAQTMIDGDISGQFYDAVTAGYQRLIGGDFRIGLAVALRSMGTVLNAAYDEDVSNYVMGNPGSGRLASIPDAIRDYAALELTVDRLSAGPTQYGFSYVLSRNAGNYPGVYGSYTEQSHPNATIDFSSAEQIVSGGKGPLPNDRTHVLKLHGSYAATFGLTASTYFTWQTGTPMSELGPHPRVPGDYVFVDGRGNLGRTPSIWDLNFRLTYDLNHLTRQRFHQKIILDVLHAFGSREAVAYSTRYNGETRESNPNFLEPTRYQLPMTIRLGVELEF